MVMKTKKVLKQSVKDVGMFSMGAVTLGAGSAAVAPYGSTYSGGMATLGAGMGAVAPLVTMKTSVGLMGSALDVVPKPKKRRKKR